MRTHTPRIFLENELIEFTDAKLNSRGFNTATELQFTISGKNISFFL